MRSVYEVATATVSFNPCFNGTYSLTLHLRSGRGTKYKMF